MTELFSHTLENWQTFYLMTGTAAATLIGLLFVALSFGVDLTTSEHPRVVTNTFITPSYLHFLQVLVISGLNIAPSTTPYLYSIILIVLDIFNLVILFRVGRLMWKYYLHTAHFHDWLWNLTLPFVIYLLIWVAAIECIQSPAQGLTWLGVATVAMLVTGIENTWHTMVWTAEQHQKKHRRKPRK